MKRPLIPGGPAAAAPPAPELLLVIMAMHARDALASDDPAAWRDALLQIASALDAITGRTSGSDSPHE
jgi:hypothetical protein